MENTEQKIDKWPTENKVPLSIEARNELLDIVNSIKSESEQFAFKECLNCVPKNKEFFRNIVMFNNAVGFNECREQTINNINNLSK